MSYLFPDRARRTTGAGDFAADRRPSGLGRLLIAFAVIAVFVATIEHAAREAPAGNAVAALSVNPGASR